MRRSVLALGMALSLTVATAPAGQAQTIDIPGLGAVGIEAVAGAVGVAALGSLGALALAGGSNQGGGPADPGDPGDPGDPSDPGDPGEEIEVPEGAVRGPDGTAFHAQYCGDKALIKAYGAAPTSGENYISYMNGTTSLSSSSRVEGSFIDTLSASFADWEEPGLVQYNGGDFSIEYAIHRRGQLDTEFDTITIPEAAFIENCPLTYPEEPAPAEYNDVTVNGVRMTAVCDDDRNTVRVRIPTSAFYSINNSPFTTTVTPRFENHGAVRAQSEFPLTVRTRPNLMEDINATHTFTRC